MADLKTYATSISFNRPVTYENKLLLKEVLLYNIVIDSRKSQLDDIKRGLAETGIVKFLKFRPYLWEADFPNSSLLSYSGVAILRKLEFIGQESNVTRVTNVVKGFVNGFIDDEERRSFVRCLTSSPLLPASSIAIYIGVYDFHISTCSLKVEIPADMNATQILENFKLAIRFGGFGRA
ncbi:uncharacterized protein LOC118436359 [Folsomia candida]|nr:uncharacterized protein LOC118436359 [Folsomia candida]